MTKKPLCPGEELLNELMKRNQEHERPLSLEQLIWGLLEIDWDSEEVRIALSYTKKSLRRALQLGGKLMLLSIGITMPLRMGRQRK
jgi:hypothetical protein